MPRRAASEFVVQAHTTILSVDLPLASTPEALTQRPKADADKWRMVIDKAGIPKQ